jgi:homocysteine S-methyltransferase
MAWVIIEAMSLLSNLLDSQKWLMLDGGLATELEARGHNLDDALWSARLLADDPAAIRRVHADYLQAGADILITASYQASPAGFQQQGYSAAEAANLLQRSVRLAQEARDAFWAEGQNRPGRSRPLVAASVGPYGAYLADGSEYSGQYGLSVADLVTFHQPRLHILAAARPDLFAFETIPSAREAQAIAHLLGEYSEMPAWVSFSCRDGLHINDGTPLAEAVRPLLAQPAGLVAVGVNCTAPRFVPDLLRRLSAVTDLPLVAYPNSGERYDTDRRCWIGLTTPVDFGRAAEAWFDAGARLIGGCCRTRPEHIRRMRVALEARIGRR